MYKNLRQIFVQNFLTPNAGQNLKASQFCQE